MKNKKLFSISAVALSISLVLGGTYAFGSGKIKIVVNGNNIATDVAPKNVNGRVLVPISTISKALGANVSWDSKTQTVSIQQGTSNPKTTDVWSQSLNDTSAEEWAAVKRTIDLFIIGYDGQDEELVKSLVVEGFDKTFIAPGVYVPGGGHFPSLLNYEIIDAKQTGSVDGRGEYKVRVKFVNYVGRSSPTENTWDIDVTPKPKSDKYLIKEVEQSAKALSSYTVFPGLTFKQEY
ncbi:copper amine oxidase N-terminal domain-containing protein [Paenibacillus solani]|uniref:copper amine oxidase N-terminal domain-containing protein n=1 Tax=Paenibacillus solani TaxID=1705565 RepID=UPI0006C8BA38|nr:copper amine oxidase N-terminal domain-containing protein [Paenibacillus solani]